MRAVQNQMGFQHNMEAVIIYEDLDVASRAIARLDNASHGEDDVTRWGLKWWRLDALNAQPAAEQALTESRDAHLMVLAVHDQAEISAALLRWLENWAARRRVQDAALAVFDGASSKTLSLAASPELSAFAARNGLSLIVQPATKSSRNRPSAFPRPEVDPPLFAPGLQPLGASPDFSHLRDWRISD
jgi:hypothetical protein